MDKLDQLRRSANMRAIRSKNMKPELIVRRLMRKLRIRFRTHVSDLPGHPDFVVPVLRKVILVHGCFWHQHSAFRCKIVRKPKSNLLYWLPKLARNKARDRTVNRQLRAAGWSVITIWECDLKHPDRCSKKLQRFLLPNSEQLFDPLLAYGIASPRELRKRGSEVEKRRGTRAKR